MENEPSKPVVWYLTTKSVFLGLVIAGPLALPLVWLTPKLSMPKKVFWTALTLVLTIFLWKTTTNLAQLLNERLADIKSTGLY